MKIREAIELLNSGEIDFLETYYTGISNTSDKRGIFKRIINKVNNESIETVNRQMQKSFFECHKDARYDYIVVLIQKGLCADVFADFLQKQKSAKKILYLWDDVSRIENFAKLVVMFDIVFSFNYDDSLQYGLKFLPLFYTDDYIYHDEEKNIDFSFIGTLHSDRARVIGKVVEYFPKKNYKWNVKLVANIESIIKEHIMMHPGYRVIPFYSTHPVTTEESAEIVKKSKMVIDIPISGQNGLTMRTIECLAARAKIITTNINVQKYNFYDNHNILIIDRDNPRIPGDFISNEYCVLDNDVYKEYSIHTWVKKLFGN